MADDVSPRAKQAAAAPAQPQGQEPIQRLVLSWPKVPLRPSDATLSYTVRHGSRSRRDDRVLEIWWLLRRHAAECGTDAGS